MFDHGEVRLQGRLASASGPPGSTRQGPKPRMTIDDRARCRALEREVRELCQANEILRKASAWIV